MNWCELGGRLSLLVDSVVEDAEDELADHGDYDDEAEDLVGGIKVFGL